MSGVEIAGNAGRSNAARTGGSGETAGGGGAGRFQEFSNPHLALFDPFQIPGRDGRVIGHRRPARRLAQPLVIGQSFLETA